MTRREPVVGAVVTRLDPAEVVEALEAAGEGVGLGESVCKQKNPLAGPFELEEERDCAALNDTNEESKHSNIAEKPSNATPNIILRLELINK